MGLTLMLQPLTAVVQPCARCAGDAVSSTVAPPYSTTVSSNVWAMYCNRSASSCLNLNNVTLVVPTQEELNYQVFMYTMFNSPAPALRDLTGEWGVQAW